MRTLIRLLRAWPLVVVFILTGSLIGFGVNRLRPPLYEASVAFSVSYDLANMGEMTQYEQDFVSGAVGDLLVAPDILEAVVHDANAQGITVDVSTLKDFSSHERKAQLWTVRVQQPDAHNAAILANLWGAHANEALQIAYAQGVRAQTLQRFLDSLSVCLQQSAQIEPVQPGCSAHDLIEIQTQMQVTAVALAEAKLASRGVLPSLVLAWSQQAEVPDHPTRRDQGVAVLAGAMAGLLFGLWWVNRNPRGVVSPLSQKASV